MGTRVRPGMRGRREARTGLIPVPSRSPCQPTTKTLLDRTQTVLVWGGLPRPRTTRSLLVCAAAETTRGATQSAPKPPWHPCDPKEFGVSLRSAHTKMIFGIDKALGEGPPIRPYQDDTQIVPPPSWYGAAWQLATSTYPLLNSKRPPEGLVGLSPPLRSTHRSLFSRDASGFIT